MTLVLALVRAIVTNNVILVEAQVVSLLNHAALRQNEKLQPGMSLSEAQLVQN
jgi:hypothetical protein